MRTDLAAPHQPDTHAEHAPAIEKELAQLAAEQQRCRQEGKRVLQAIGGNESRSDMTTRRLAELDERDHQLEQRMAELRDELVAVQGETVSAAAIQRAVALFDPVLRRSADPGLLAKVGPG